MQDSSFLKKEFNDLNESTVLLLVQEENFNVEELNLFVAVKEWAIKECGRRGMEANGSTVRQVRSSTMDSNNFIKC